MASTVVRAIRRWIGWSNCAPGGLTAHPMAIGALAALVINDHVLKQLAPGFATGKASDIAGLVMAPLMIVGALELARITRLADRGRVIAIACLATAVVFAAVKAIPAATDVYNNSLGLLQWLVGGGFIDGRTPVPTRGVTDPSDLLAIPAVLLAFAIAGPRQLTTTLPQRRLPAFSVAILFVAGLASVATSPAMRSSSADFEEQLQLTQDAPAITRHLSIAIVNRDAKLDEIHLLARVYTKAGNSELDTEGVLVTLVADDKSGLVAPSGRYFGAELSFTEPCRQSCHDGATVIVRLTDPAIAAAGPITTNLAVSLVAGANEEGTGEVDIDLGLTSDADRAFQGSPQEIAATRTGSTHVGVDEPQSSDAFDIVIDAAALREPYGYPLVGEITVWHDNKTAIGHDNALTSGFQFESPSAIPYAWPYSFVSVGIGWTDEPLPPPTIIDLLPLCEAETECRIRATLTVSYEDYVNDPPPSGQPPVRGSISFDWHVQVRLLSFDGRALPDGLITFEPAD